MFTVRQFDAKTLSWWADQRADIDFAPPYQRQGGLWSERDKAFLIDSVLNEFDIPKIYIADFTFGPANFNERNLRYAVIDGKQRFEAIFDFIDGRLVLNSDFVFTDEPALRLGGLSYKDLRAQYPKVASRFANYNLTVMSVITDEEAKINELFVRLNRNKTLSGPEIRNAMQGIVPKLIRGLADHEVISTCVRFSTKRGAGLDAAGKCLLLEFRGRIVDTKRVRLDRFVEEGAQADAGVADFERAADRVRTNFDAMARIFTERDPLLAGQGVFPVYYWLVRNTDPDYHDEIRPFLVAFEEARKRNREIARDPERISELDPELTTYDQLNRSINDQGSIEGRYEILEEGLNQFNPGS
jgi:hypothetical protein